MVANMAGPAHCYHQLGTGVDSSESFCGRAKAWISSGSFPAFYVGCINFIIGFSQQPGDFWSEVIYSSKFIWVDVGDFLVKTRVIPSFLSKNLPSPGSDLWDLCPKCCGRTRCFLDQKKLVLLYRRWQPLILSWNVALQNSCCQGPFQILQQTMSLGIRPLMFLACATLRVFTSF